MMNCSTVLVQNTWGVHLNFEGRFSSPPICPPGLHNFSRKIGRGEELLYGMQIFRLLPIYMQDMRLNF
jgi:hypothetical protein